MRQLSAKKTRRSGAEETFAKHAEEAKAACPISQALASVDEIEVSARLVEAS